MRSDPPSQWDSAYGAGAHEGDLKRQSRKGGERMYYSSVCIPARIHMKLNTGKYVIPIPEGLWLAQRRNSVEWRILVMKIGVADAGGGR